MICSDCGGEYQETDLKCPFCGKENEIMAERLKQEKLKALDREAEEIQKLPEQIVTNTTNRVLKITGIAFGVLVIFILLGVAVTQLYTNYEYKNTQRKIQEIEAVYASGDLDELSAYMEDRKLYGSEFDKYQNVKYAYDEYQYACEVVDRLQEVLKQNYFLEESPAEQKERISSELTIELQALIRAIHKIDSVIEEYGTLDDMSALREVRISCITLLEDELGFNEKQIEELLALDSPEETVLSSYIETIYEKWSEENRV